MLKNSQALLIPVCLGIVNWSILLIDSNLFQPTIDLKIQLPIQPCHLVLLLVGYYCFSRNQTVLDISFYWVCTGLFHSILCPTRDLAFPAEWSWFYFGHLFPLLTLLYFQQKHNERLSANSVEVSFQPFFVLATMVFFPLNLLLGSNYFFIMGFPGYESDSALFSFFWCLFFSLYCLIHFRIYRLLINKVFPPNPRQA